MRSLTWREYLVRLKWLDDQWNRPTRSDNYLMQVAYEVRRGNVKHPDKIQFKDLEIQFRDKVEGSTPSSQKMSREQATAIAKAAWRMRIPDWSRIPSPSDS